MVHCASVFLKQLVSLLDMIDLSHEYNFLLYIPEIFKSNVYYISVGRQKININDTKNVSEVEIGGYWKPNGCHSRHRIAIVIPIRDRHEHLNVLLRYLHPLLQRQQLEYKIFVAEQVINSYVSKCHTRVLFPRYYITLC